MPARTEPVIDTIAGVVVRDHRPAGVAVAADHVEHARRAGTRPAISASSTVDGRRGVGRLEHHRVAGGDAPGRTSRPPSSSGSSTARPGRTTPTGSRRIDRGHARPCTRRRCGPRACGPRRRRSGSGRPSAGSPRSRSARSACRCSRPRPRSARRRGPRPRRRSGAAPALRSTGVVSRHASNAAAAAAMAASTSAGPDSGGRRRTPRPSTGLTTSVVRPSAASTCSPLTKFWMTRVMGCLASLRGRPER